MAIFYAAGGVPVHSCTLVGTRKEALDFPLGDIRLGFCRACGFIANTRYDPGAQDYATGYEETQGFSPRFNAFAESLAKRLIDRYGIRNKTVLEIGCGKGEFLALLSRLGDNRGIGIDPSYVPGRLSEDQTTRLTFIRDFYSHKYSHIEADFICCRHTLEHIAHTRSFLQTIRQAIGTNTHPIIFFEVPDALRVLRGGAFWDIYYEHCSYFSAGSLAMLFCSMSFDVIEFGLDYGGQYVLLVARPARKPTRPHLAFEDDLAELSDAVGAFSDKCNLKLEQWRTYLENAAASNQRVVVWGSGSKGVAFLTTLGITSEIEYVVDINPNRHGKYMPGSGQQIVPPEFLATLKPDAVVIMNPIYRGEIRKDLRRLGINPEIVPV